MHFPIKFIHGTKQNIMPRVDPTLKLENFKFSVAKIVENYVPKILHYNVKLDNRRRN